MRSPISNAKKVSLLVCALLLCAAAFWGERIFNFGLRRYLAVNGVSSHYLRKGSTTIFYFEGGEENPRTVILLHGVGGNSLTSWFRLLPALAEKYHVLAPDLFFANLPDLVNSGYHVRSEQRLVDLLMGAKKISKASFVGLSFGAWPALQTALDRPDRVEQLILLSPLDGSANDILQNLHLDKENPGRDFYYRLFKNPPPVPSPFLWAHWERTTRIIQSLPHFRRQLSLEGRQLNQALTRVTCPTLVVYGEADRIIPKEHFDFIADRIPKCTLVGIKESGHGLVWDQPKRLKESIESFLSAGGG